MAQFETPSHHPQASYVDAIEEFQLDGLHTDLDSQSLRHVEAFHEHLMVIASVEDEAVVGAHGRVPETRLWWVDGGVFLGSLRIRHRLTEALRMDGGHIGYSVRPSARRRGHATAMLAAALPRAARLGIDPALITCNLSNDASRRVIETNGGALFDADDTMLRFWVPTNSPEVGRPDSS